MSWMERSMYTLMRELRLKARVRLLNQNDFVCLRREGVAVYFDEDRYFTARRVLETAIVIRKNLESFLSVTETPIVLFSDRDRLRDSGHIKYQDEILGYYRDGLVHLLSPASYPQESPYDYAAVLAHEMTHLALDHAMDGNCPLWLSEGMSLYVEQVVTGKAPELTMEAAPASFGRFEAAFPLMEKEENYAAAYILTAGILNDFGAEGMARFMKHLRDGRGPRDSFQKAVGGDLNQYYKEKLL